MKIQAPKTNRTGIHTARTINRVSSFFLLSVFSFETTGENSPFTWKKKRK
jgi:hypothetical protein